MTAPALFLQRYLAACALGVGLGVWYGFLRPVRPRTLGDLLFLPILFWAWLYLSFGICKGDLRLGYCSGLLVGGLAWEWTVGRWLRPIFSGFWGFWQKIFIKLWKNIIIFSAVLPM